MMDRAQGHSTHDPRLEQQQLQHQPYDSQPSPTPRNHLSRSVSYPTASQNPYAMQIHESMGSNSLPVSQHKDDPSGSYAGLGISMQAAENSQNQTLHPPDSPFRTQSAQFQYSQAQPPTPSFPVLRSSSPASSIWSASDTSPSTNLSGFIPRLHKMVSDEKYQGLISWNATGTSFYITRVQDFAATVLPLHFKHSNFSSFVRQLNMYGFHKVNKTPRGYKIASENQVWEFSHTKFIRHRPDLLDEIKRRQGDVDFIREGDLSTHISLMQVQQNDIMKQLNSLQEQVGALVNGLNETRKRQASQEERLKMVLDYLEKQQSQSPTSSQSASQTSNTGTIRRISSQKTPSRRPSNVSRLVLDESIDRKYTITTPHELETYFESEMPVGTLGTPHSSPPASQPSSGSSQQRSPPTTKTLRAAPSFSTPSSVNTSSTQYTPASSISSLSSIQHQRSQSAQNISPTIRRNKSMVMPALPSPNVTPSPVYHYPAQYAQISSSVDNQLMSNENLRPQSSHTAQPPATYSSAAAPYATPPRIQQPFQFQTPIRQDQFEAMQLASGFIPFQRRRRNNSDVTEDMELS